MRYFPSKIESKWQKRWLKEKTFEPDFKRARKPFYNLMMFPYPSAEGLHAGNMYAFTGADIYGRFKRMQGFDVFEPIGLDGFGIHSENYAIKAGRHPAKQAKISEKNFYRQLETLGNGFSWQERLETYDPEYYRWTQWIFVQMFKRNLAYRKKASVNWCPSCKTVLADEQVIKKSKIKIQNAKLQFKIQKEQNDEITVSVCERCETAVTKKELEQWFFRITDYAERLVNNLEAIDWSEKVKIAQRNWIGRSEGALIKFQIPNSKFQIEAFTTRPDTLFGATYIILAPEHPLIKNLESGIKNPEEVSAYVKKAKGKSTEDRIAEGREKTGVKLKGISAINPANKEEIPVWVADYVLGHVGTGAIMAVPAHDQRDFEFAAKYGLPSLIVICPHYPATTCPVLDRAYVGTGHLVASGKFDGMPSEQAKMEIARFVGGKRVVTYRLRDWLISRQRYWGPPIPMIFCATCHKKGIGEQKDMPGWFAVPEKDLPVKLPMVRDFRPTGGEQSPLAQVEKFYKVRCPKCRARARRETDVSDTFLDSAWYYLRYPSVRENSRPWSPAVTKKWLPVDMYIGGAEHAVLHLLYVRFLAMAFFDRGLIHFEEPFKKFRAHGLLIKDGAKMSKSKGNVVNPDEYIRAYGADALRMYLMFMGPFEQGGDFRDTGIRGITRFLERVWRFVHEQKTKNKKQKASIADDLNRAIHLAIKKITDDIEGLQYNTAISSLMVLLNAFEERPQAVSRHEVELFLRLLAPFAPHISEELWHTLGNRKSIHRASWPMADEKYLIAETTALTIQVNGRMRDRIEIPAGAAESLVRELAIKSPKIREWIAEKEIKKFIYIPGRIVNIVV